MIKAASIAYAVFMAALTGLFCFGMVLVFSLNTNLEDHYQMQASLVQDSYSALAYGRANFYELVEDQWNDGPGISPGITHRFKKQPWGLFHVLSTQSKSKSDTLTQHYLVAPEMEQNAPVLYLRDNGEPLKLSGEVTITGNINCGSKGIKKVQIESQVVNKINQNGVVSTAGTITPKLNLTPSLLPENLLEATVLDPQLSTSIDFNEPMGLIMADRLIANVNIAGNVAIQSKDTLTIAATAILKDVLVIAPKVIIQSGFKGSLQVLAGQEIVLEQEVSLVYPSALVITGKIQEKSNITLGKSCSVAGAIVVPGQGMQAESNHTIIIGEDSKVTGQIYSGGTLELYGNVAGQIVAASLLHKGKSTQYSNLLKDIKVEWPEQPQWLFGVNKDNSFNPPLVLKKV